MASIMVGPSPAAARARASPTARRTAITSLPSMRAPGIAYAAARCASSVTGVVVAIGEYSP